MPKVLTDLTIDEVSTVARAANRHCKVLLRKGDVREENIATAVAGLTKCVEAIRADDATSEATKRKWIDIAVAKCGEDLKKIDEALEVDERGDEPDLADDEEGPTVPADLVDRVVAMHEGKLSRAEAMMWLLTHPLGREVARAHKREKPMSRTEELQALSKRVGGVTAMAKVFVEDQDSHGVSQDEFVSLIGEYDRQPGESTAKCFTRHYTAQTADGLALRKAVAVCKGMATLAPSVSGGLDEERTAVNSTESSEAYRQLMELAEKQHAARNITVAQAFAEELTRPENRELAQKALARPVAPADGRYEFPR
jgi:hypothetical protein